ncbi:MAG: Uracil-DNA glycosylase, family 5, partial [uncultured Acetobacteraceae bacterium]
GGRQQRRRRRRSRRPGPRLPALPAAGGLAGSEPRGGAGLAQRPRPFLGSAGRAVAGARHGARPARRQPHRAALHRRLRGPIALRHPAEARPRGGRLRGAAGRRAGPDWLPRDQRGALRAAGQPAPAGRDPYLQPLPPGRVGGDAGAAGGAGPRHPGPRRVAARGRPAHEPPPLRARRRLRPAERAGAGRQLPRQPLQHLHPPPDAGDVRGGGGRSEAPRLPV